MQERPLPQWLLNLEAKKRARRAKDVKRKKIAAAKTVAEKDYLDANNRKMGWKTFAQLEDEAAERQRKADAREAADARAAAALAVARFACPAAARLRRPLG